MDISKLLHKDLRELCETADKVRAENVGDVVHIRALLEFSNICARNCDYCGLRAGNVKLSRYAMALPEIASVARSAIEVGYKTIVLQSGESKRYDMQKFAEMINKISDKIAVTLSLGELSYAELKLLRDAGAKRYLLKFETADSKLYEKLHKGYSLQDRLDCLSAIRELRYEVGSGFLVGLQGENEDTLAQNLQLLKDLRCDMAGIGVFIPHAQTPLGNCSIGNIELTKKCVAITRLLLPKCNIPITTSLGMACDKYQMFAGGANVIMQNVTPQSFVNDYQIYPKGKVVTNLAEDRKKLESDLTKLARRPL